MDQLDTQVSDLRSFLLDGTAPTHLPPSHLPPSPSPSGACHPRGPGRSSSSVAQVPLQLKAQPHRPSQVQAATLQAKLDAIPGGAIPTPQSGSFHNIVAPHNSADGGSTISGAPAFNNGFHQGNGFDRRPSPDAATSVSAGPKRKNSEDESAAKQHRSKRNRYIAIACNQCKRRKIKCNGEVPCQRCGHLNLECLYAPNCCATSLRDSDEFKQMAAQVAQLQEQVDAMFGDLSTLRRETVCLAPSHQSHQQEQEQGQQHDQQHQQRQRQQKQPQSLTVNRGREPEHVLPPPSSTATHSPSAILAVPSLSRTSMASSSSLRVPPNCPGPTSFEFTYGMAKNTLQNMGFGDAVNTTSRGGTSFETETAGLPSPTMPQPTAGRVPPTACLPKTMVDPLWEFSKDDMVRTCRMHEEEIGNMYPVIPICDMIEYAKSVGAWMESATASLQREEGSYSHPHEHKLQRKLQQEEEAWMSDLRTMTLKVIMCCGLVIEHHGHSEQAVRLYASVQPMIDRMMMNDPVEVRALPLLGLVGGYRWLTNDDVLAWRVIGHVARLCMEMGLHRREGLAKISDPYVRRNGLYTFWSAYVLDRRWSFGTGLPFVVEDEKIDPKLPLPDEDSFLFAMVSYSRLGAKVWRFVDFFEPAVIRELDRRDFETLDQEILSWYQSIPEAARVSSLAIEALPLPTALVSKEQRLQIWARLRLNQMRIWLYQPVLFTALSIDGNMALAQRVVDLAKETLLYLYALNSHTNLYRRAQVFYHQFLTSAIAVLFLASTHAPVHFSRQCRVEFNKGLELVKDLAARSWISERLWRSIRPLKEYAPRLGLRKDDADDEPTPEAAQSPVSAQAPQYHCQTYSEHGISVGATLLNYALETLPLSAKQDSEEEFASRPVDVDRVADPIPPSQSRKSMAPFIMPSVQGPPRSLPSQQRETRQEFNNMAGLFDEDYATATDQSTRKGDAGGDGSMPSSDPVGPATPMFTTPYQQQQKQHPDQHMRNNSLREAQLQSAAAAAAAAAAAQQLSGYGLGPNVGVSMGTVWTASMAPIIGPVGSRHDTPGSGDGLGPGAVGNPDVEPWKHMKQLF